MSRFTAWDVNIVCPPINDTYKKVALNGKEKRCEIYVTAVKYHVSTN
jgi:hypothetical protein